EGDGSRYSTSGGAHRGPGLSAWTAWIGFGLDGGLDVDDVWRCLWETLRQAQGRLLGIVVPGRLSGLLLRFRICRTGLRRRGGGVRPRSTVGFFLRLLPGRGFVSPGR